MIREEFFAIAGQALRQHRGADSVRIVSITPGAMGPDIEWEAPLLAPQRERSALGILGPVAGPLVLTMLAGTLAARWRDGAPRCPIDWEDQLLDRHKRIFRQYSPTTGPGWYWLLTAAAQAIRVVGIPKGLRTTDIKEKFGTLRWTVEANEDCSRIDEIMDAVEHLSAFICEDCGKPGRIRSGGWLRAQCARCAEGRPR